jgi:aldehyde dehydrogenase (NAD+)
VVLNIAPWNYPIQTALVPLVSILAAGNCAVLKPSEFAPNCSRIIAELINENFPPEYCHVAEGGVEETQQLLSQKWDFIAFTGSPRVGQIIAEAAAQTLTPTLLELGGKSPCIVHKDAKLPIAARRILWGKFLNAGQTCVAPDYLLAEKTIADQLVHQLSQRIEDFYGENPEKSADYCRIVNEKHFQRLSTYLSSKNLVHGGGTHGDELYIEPTILYPCHWSDEIMKEEIFGPILPVIPYDDIDEAIQKIKERERPLAFYIFTCDKNLQEKLIESISFGGGAVNATVLQTANLHLPFGGVGNSGMGRYHGRKGFDAFTYEKSIFKKSNLIDPDLIYPPYKEKLKIIKRFFS